MFIIATFFGKIAINVEDLWFEYDHAISVENSLNTAWVIYHLNKVWDTLCGILLNNDIKIIQSCIELKWKYAISQ